MQHVQAEVLQSTSCFIVYREQIDKTWFNQTIHHGTTTARTTTSLMGNTEALSISLSSRQEIHPLLLKTYLHLKNIAPAWMYMWQHTRKQTRRIGHFWGKWASNRTDKYENDRKQFRKQNCILSNIFYFIDVIWQMWFKQEIKHRLHLNYGHCVKLKIAS